MPLQRFKVCVTSRAFSLFWGKQCFQFILHRVWSTLEYMAIDWFIIPFDGHRDSGADDDDPCNVYTLS